MLRETTDQIKPIHDVHEVFQALSFETPMQKIVDYCDAYIDTDEKIEPFMALIVNCSNSTRHLKINGRIPDEDVIKQKLS